MKSIVGSACAILGLIGATLLGIYAQDLAYYVHEQFPAIDLGAAITVITFCSIGLFISIPLLFFIFNREAETSKTIAVLGSVVLGIPVSMWSFFVWAMWMG
ncbi:hypothetical protein QWT69_14165 [Sporosarcina oncorhynchi]|uniref:Uncharacterized protein n=1 Tax=Sporosarcina oncorhynchi TaxID=3056444 RepID=A0ABZ0L6L0_9BACL|nr:hypothetical protein [Sporosarcina sp. T2O-4]WOV87004.1 hypothetical protein QWT69_14165 [Sporosarcina sp. T2O-4]